MKKRVWSACAVAAACFVLQATAPSQAADSDNTLPKDSRSYEAQAAGPFWWASASVSESNRMVMDIRGPSTANYAAVHLWDWHGGNSQYWYFDYVGTWQNFTVWHFRSLYSNKCLDLQGTGISNGTPVNQRDCDYSDDGQEWRQEYRFTGPDGYAYYRFVNVSSGLCLDNTGGSSANGNKIQIWACSSGTNYNQLWY